MSSLQSNAPEPRLFNSEITRHAGPCRFTGTCISDLSSLRATLKQHFHQDIEQWIVSDLSLGAWTAHQIAREFLDQLGLTDLPKWTCDRGGSSNAETILRRETDADVLGDLIDQEAQGDLSLLKALRLAETVTVAASARPSSLFLVILARQNMPWRQENLRFLEFLAHAFALNEQSLVLVRGNWDTAPLPAHWRIRWLASSPIDEASKAVAAPVLRLLPGVIRPEVAEVLSLKQDRAGSLVLRGGHLLVDPACRSQASAADRPLYDQLTTVAALPESLRGYVNLHCSNYYCSSAVLYREAWRQLCDGSGDIALDLIEHAMRCSRIKEERTRLLLDLQGLRIATHRFEEAAEAKDLGEGTAAELAGAFCQTKGWALTMLGRAKEGRTYLENARRLLVPLLKGTRRSLYLNNIYALSCLKCGDVRGALEVQRQIEHDLAGHAREEGRRDWRLTYVNCINLARLHCKLGDFGQALAYFLRAFDTTLGVRSESESIYTNICLGRVYRELGELQKAFGYWLRACLHWVSADAPEALAPRVAASILKRPLAHHEVVTEEISRTLYQEVLAAARVVGIEHGCTATGRGTPVIFRRATAVNRPAHPDCLVIAEEGWSIIVSPTAPSPVYDGSWNQQLRNLLCLLLRETSAGGLGTLTGSLLVPESLGQEIPGELRTVFSMALRLQLGLICYAGKQIALPSAYRDRALGLLSVRVGPAVDQVHNDSGRIRITFKRHYPPKELSPVESKLLSERDCPKTLLELADANQLALSTLIRCAQDLQEARIIDLEASDEIIAEQIFDSDHSIPTGGEQLTRV